MRGKLFRRTSSTYDLGEHGIRTFAHNIYLHLLANALLHNMYVVLVYIFIYICIRSIHVSVKRTSTTMVWRSER